MTHRTHLTILLSLLMLAPLALPLAEAKAPLTGTFLAVDASVEASASEVACETPWDGYGYACSPASYEYATIAEPAALALSDDEVSDLIALPFAFPLYGASRLALRVSSNGFLLFDENATEHGCCNGPVLPDAAAPNAVVAGYWTDLYPPGGGNITHGTARTSDGYAFVVDWADVPLYGTVTPQSFQILLFPDGRVKLQYASVIGESRVQSAGIEDCTGSNGIQFARGTLTMAGVAAMIAPPGAPTAPACADVPSNTPPSIVIESPSYGATLSGIVAVSGFASDADAGDQVEWVNVDLGGHYASTNGTSAWRAMLDTTLLPDGWHVLRAEAYDGAAWGSTSIDVLVQNGGSHGPTVTLDSPTAGATVSGWISVEGAYDDADGDFGTLRLFVNGLESGSIGGVGPGRYSFGLQTADHPDGWATICVEATDGSAFSAACSNVYFQNAGGNTPPVSYFTSPSNGATVTGVILLEGYAYENDVGDSVRAVEVIVDGEAGRIMDGTSYWSGFLDTTRLSDGWHTLTVEAQDRLGWSFGQQIQVLVDNEPEERHAPEVTIYYPRGGATVAGIVEAHGGAWDADGDLGGVEVRVDGGEWRLAGAPGWTRFIDTRALGDGLHDLEARAFDATGLVSPIALTQFVVRNEGSPAPAITIDSPSNGASVGGTIDIVGRAFAPGGLVQHVEVSLGGEGNWRTAFGADAWTHRVSVLQYESGQWLPIFARAYDGHAWSEPVMTYVLVENAPDLRIGAEDIEVARRPVQTDAGSVPVVQGTHRTIRVTVHNDGALASTTALLATSVSTRGAAALSASSEWWFVQVPPIRAGGSVTLELAWDSTRYVGDVTVTARADLAEDRDYHDNEASVDTFVLVGGLGGAQL